MKSDPKRIKLHIFFRRPVVGDHFSIERLFDAIAKSLPAEQFEVHRLVCPFESKGILRRLALTIWAALHQGDINHITGDVNFLGLLMCKARTVLTIHDSASMARLTGLRRWLYGMIWLRLPVWRAGLITVISETTLQETLSFVNAESSKFAIIPNCLTVGIENTPRAWPQTRPRFLVVGTKPNKNLHRIINALQGIPCLLVVVGRLTDAHLQLIASAGLELENHINLDDSAIVRQYQNADVVLFVPTYEGFGLPILEAQAAGKPLITSKRSPMQEVAGDGSCLVDPDNIDEIRKAVQQVMQDSSYRAALIESGTRNVQKYSPKVIAERYAATYQEIASNKTS